MNILNLYYIGELIEYLERAPVMKGYVKGDNQIYDNVDRLKRRIEIAGEFKSVEPIIKAILELLEPYNESEELKDTDRRRYRDHIKKIQSLVTDRCAKITVFLPVQECTLDKKCLMNLMDATHSSFFDKVVWDDLSDIAQNDFSDSAKCLLLGAATPAAMSIVRAGEAAVRSYYQKKMGNDPLGRAWGNLTTELRQTSGINTDIISNLDYIRKTKRNITAHPDKIYNQREAESVFMQLISTVHELYYDTV